ncbi:hypothetical protein SH139x_005025 [Planctomycetaceae bacterium SH139]
MRSVAAALPFVVLTIICWGNYGPLMHHGQAYMGDALRPFIGVGFAYFLIAVLVPLGILKIGGEKGHWTARGATLSFLAGCAGALGALGVIMAFTFKGSPVYVIPMVFGGAPIVNTIVTMTLAKTYDRVSPKFLLAILTAAIGAAGVLYFKPAAPPRAGAAEANIPAVIASIVTAVICWGSYGPILHLGQSKMGGSRMRPFLCVGIAYFFMAVALPAVLIPALGKEFGDWTTPEMTKGLLWSLAGGAAGAMGALGIVLAFNFGGKPIFVMPLVFGLAPIVNTITTLTESNRWGDIGVTFVVALAVTILGAVCVLLFAPKPSPPGKAAVTAPTVDPATAGNPA